MMDEVCRNATCGDVCSSHAWGSLACCSSSHRSGEKHGRNKPYTPKHVPFSHILHKCGFATPFLEISVTMMKNITKLDNIKEKQHAHCISYNINLPG